MALSPKRMAFCREYMLDRCATQAYIRAGYSKGGAAQAAEKLLRNADVKAEIAERERRLALQADVTVGEVIGLLRGQAQDGSTRATELMGKHIGMWREVADAQGGESLVERLERLEGERE